MHTKSLRSNKSGRYKVTMYIFRLKQRIWATDDDYCNLETIPIRIDTKIPDLTWKHKLKQTSLRVESAHIMPLNKNRGDSRLYQ